MQGENASDKVGLEVKLDGLAEVACELLKVVVVAEDGHYVHTGLTVYVTG